MAIKRPRIDLEKLGIIHENASDRYQRREDLTRNGQESARSKLDQIAEHNAREDDIARRIHQKITKGGLWLDMRDLMGDMGPVMREDVRPAMRNGHQRLTEDFPTSHDDMLFEDYPTPQPKARSLPQPQRQPKRQSLSEQISHSVQPWGVKKFLGETRGGATVPVWKVNNTKTGSQVDKMFRIETVAEKVAALLNESGDPSDPRVVSLIAAYDKRDRLLKEARQLEKTAEGKPMKTERLRAVRAEINQLDYRLGI